MPVEAVVWASVGNVSGIILNYWLGRWGRGLFRRRSPGTIRDGGWLSRYGRWGLAFSWLPIIGDPLTVAAGAMSVEIPFFLMVAGGSRVGRYVLIAAFML